MTPEERANKLWEEWEPFAYASDDARPSSGFKDAIAAAIREAVEEERAKCAMRVELTFVEARDTEFDLGFETARKVFAAAIRARSATSPTDTAG